MSKDELGRQLSDLVTANDLVVIDVSHAEFIDSSFPHNQLGSRAALLNSRGRCRPRPSAGIRGWRANDRARRIRCLPCRHPHPRPDRFAFARRGERSTGEPADGPTTDSRQRVPDVYRPVSPESGAVIAEFPIAFADASGRFVVNSGILTGREATQAEIDRLAQSLYSDAGAGPDLTITAVRRQDYGHDIETVSHQVIVKATCGPAPDVQEICRIWALGCADDRRVEPLEF